MPVWMEMKLSLFVRLSHAPTIKTINLHLKNNQSDLKGQTQQHGASLRVKFTSVSLTT